MSSKFPAPATLIRMGLAFSAGAFATIAQAAPGPSFDCARVTSLVNRTICASPELSALDRQLADHYRALLAQSGAEAESLRREEAKWLHEVRDPCPDAACIAQAYAVWDAVLVARSRRLAGAASAAANAVPGSAAGGTPGATAGVAPRQAAAAPSQPPARHGPSPAADAETQPFAVDPALLADARALRGHACASGEDVPRDAGYLPVPGELPVVSNGSVVLVRRRIGADFAFLLDTRRNACRMVDVVALPARGQVSDLLQCVVPADDGSSTPLSVGVGLRRPGQKAPIAYWEVDVAHGRFIRQPLGVLAWSERVRCQEPEVGD